MKRFDLRFVIPAVVCGCLMLSGCGGGPAMEEREGSPPIDGAPANGKSEPTKTSFHPRAENVIRVSHAVWKQDGHTHGAEKALTDSICVLMPVGGSKVTGTLHFSQVDGGIHVTGEVKGLKPGMHGFHVHEFGDLTDMETGKSTGGHFNPEHKMHGSRDAEERHAGDFGNIEADAAGVAKIDFIDKMIKMSGEMSIIGRGIVIHADEDKYTQPTGDAGGRVAIGVIGVTKSAE